MNSTDLILYLCFTEYENIKMADKKVGDNVALIQVKQNDNILQFVCEYCACARAPHKLLHTL
jgi:hypothetical protein